MTPCTLGQSSRSLPCRPLGASPSITLSTTKALTSPTKVEKSLAQLIRQMEHIPAKQKQHRQSRVAHGHLQNPLDPNQEPGPGSPGASSPPQAVVVALARPRHSHPLRGYLLFESNSEEEAEVQPKNPRLWTLTTSYLVYQEWVTKAQMVLRQEQWWDQALRERSEQLHVGDDGLSQEANQQRVCRTKWQATAPRHSEC